MNKDSFLSYKSITVPANGKRNVDISGAFFVCKEAAEAFQMQIDDGEQFPMEVGLGFRLKDGDTFKRLSLINEESSALTIEFYAGAGEVEDNRLNSRLDRVAVSVRNALTVTTGQSTSLATGNNLALTGVRTIGSYTNVRRKILIITNLHATLDLILRDWQDNQIATIFPRQPWAGEIMDDCSILNSSGSTINFQVCEIFYTQ